MSLLVFALTLAPVQVQAGQGTPAGSATYHGAYPSDFVVKVLSANDLGMHCMDREFSIFSILPPFNVVRAQVVRPTNTSKPTVLDNSLIEVTYQAITDPHGSHNSTSIGKTDFWQHVSGLFGVALPPGVGLTGLTMPADAANPGPQPMTYDPATKSWIAAGIPITPVDDAGHTNTYPMLRITARWKQTHAPVSSVDVVVPVAQETDCSNCHKTGGIAASSGSIAWSTDPDLERQTKFNVLKLHDSKQGTSLENSQPVLCASCHYSPALDLSGSGPQGSQVGHVYFSAAMHEYHGQLVDGQGNPVFPHNGTANQTCYQCHPGAITQCARGAMKTGGMECLNCHGDMLSVGGTYPLLPGGSIDGTNDGHSRRPWKDLPRCQSCHTGDALSHLSGTGYVLATDGIRLKQAYKTGDNSASAILATNKRFAENTNSLYRFSAGHGNVSCENCHGSTHAEWPNADPLANDNVAATQLQGHSGVIIECSTCHQRNTLPAQTMNGPHGMHVVADQRFYFDEHGHENLYEQNPNQCKTCHGANLNGTALSRAAANRTFVTDQGTFHVNKGQMIGCNICHSKP
jgi:hypothetical protein